MNRLPHATLLVLSLLLGASAWGDTVQERYHALKSGSSTLPGAAITLASTEHDGVLSAEVSSLLPFPFETAATALARTGNWCEFMPLHFNIKACTYRMAPEGEQLTLYSGRKTYQSPDDSHLLNYRVARREQGDDRLSMLLLAASGPAGTRDYRIEVEAQRIAEGTLLQIRSSYRGSMTSALLTRSYLSTLGRGKVGFTRVEQEGELRYVQGVRGVIERNVMRYHLAINTFLATHALPESSRREAALKRWFEQNDSYYEQLHEMPEDEYLAIKRREWENQQQLQQVLNEQQERLALR